MRRLQRPLLYLTYDYPGVLGYKYSHRPKRCSYQLYFNALFQIGETKRFANRLFARIPKRGSNAWGPTTDVRFPNERSAGG